MDGYTTTPGVWLYHNTWCMVIPQHLVYGYTTTPGVWLYHHTWCMVIPPHLVYGYTTTPGGWLYHNTWCMVIPQHLVYGYTTTPGVWLYHNTWCMVIQQHLVYGYTTTPGVWLYHNTWWMMWSRRREHSTLTSNKTSILINPVQPFQTLGRFIHSTFVLASIVSSLVFYSTMICHCINVGLHKSVNTHITLVHSSVSTWHQTVVDNCVCVV